jgi:TatA/E family protein of Tat protein translocase
MTHSLAILPGGLGTGEILFIFAVVLLLFGPRKLPEIARSIGRTLDHLRKASQEFKDQVMEIEEDARQTIEAEAGELMGAEDGEDDPFLEDLENWDDEDPYNDIPDDDPDAIPDEEAQDDGRREDTYAG